MCGPLTGQLFKCSQFGFNYKVPFGWVDRTQEMQTPETPTENIQGEGGGSAQPSQISSKSQTLLSVFERPPGAPGETVNSAVVIAAEPRDSYPQIKTAADYFGPISDVATQRGFTAVSDPYAFNLGTTRLVREDFRGQHGKSPIFQSSVVIMARRQILSFTFVAGTEDDVEDLIANLSFAPIAGNKHVRP